MTSNMGTYSKSIYKHQPCGTRMDMGEAGIDVIVRSISSWADFKPNKAYPGRVKYAGHTDNPPYDVYRYISTLEDVLRPLEEMGRDLLGEEAMEHHCRRWAAEDELRNNPPNDSFVMIAFGATPGPGAEIVKSIINGSGVRVSLVHLQEEAYLKSALIHAEGCDSEWSRYYQGERQPLSPGEAATLGLEEFEEEKVTLVITEHAAVVDFLVERGLVQEGTRVVSSATKEDVRDRHVIGDLPLDVAAVARSVTSIEFSGPLVAGEEGVTVKQVRDLFRGTKRFSVSGR